MDQSSDLLYAFEIMIAGMVFVFAFLGLLVLVVKGVAAALPPEIAPVTTSVRHKKSTTGQPSPAAPISAAKHAAISAAIHRYRQDHS